MKLENQVCSLELSKRLKELGVKQESQFCWKLGGKLGEPQHSYLVYMEQERHMLGTADSAWRFYSAFTVAELGEMLPKELDVNGVWSWDCGPEYKMIDQYENGKLLREQKKDWFWTCGYRYSGQHFTDNTEANARAKMLVYLLENNLCQTQP